ncbi:hypothetical protein EON65_39510, partial [archaeon]
MLRAARHCRTPLQGIYANTRQVAQLTVKRVGRVRQFWQSSTPPRLALTIAAATAYQLHQQLSYCDGAIYADSHEALVAAGTADDSAALARQTVSSGLQRWLQQLQHWLALLYRALYLLFAYSPAALSSPLLLVSGGADWWWPVLLGCMKRAGPCSVKFAQWLSTRPDLFPLELCNRCQALQSYPGQLSWREARSVLDRELGAGWRQQMR